MSNSNQAIEKQKVATINLKDYSQLIHGNTKVEMITQLRKIPIQGQLASNISLFSFQSKEDKFVKEVSELATGDEVISRLGSELGSPREEETEAEFVDRGKNTLRKILRDILNQK